MSKLWKSNKYGSESIDLPCGNIVVYYDGTASKYAPDDQRGYLFTLFDRRSKKHYKDIELAKEAALLLATKLLRQSLDMIELEK